MDGRVGRRDFLGGATGVAALSFGAPALAQEHAAPQTAGGLSQLPYQERTRADRMRWWHEAKFGMFIHWGLYSVIGHQEWVMESEGIPIPQYERLARHFNPKPGCAREWARLA